MAQTRRDYWAKLIAEQEEAGETAQAFCRGRGLSDQTFYVWRSRLAREPRPRFALVTTKAPPAVSNAKEPALELVFATGERLRIHNGADAATLRLALEAIRA